MSLSYRSTTPETRFVLERSEDGRERCATAVRQPGDNFWTCTVTHPSGERWTQRYHCHSDTVVPAMANWLASKKHDFIQDKAKGDRKPLQLDTSVRISPNDPDYFKR
jgi:hypothetical protein